MAFRVSGKNIDLGEALRSRISSRVSEATAKYFDGGFSGHVTVGKEAFGFRTECVIHLDSGIVLEADAFAPDAYASADEAAIRMEKRLRRYKRRLKDPRYAGSAGRGRRRALTGYHGIPIVRRRTTGARSSVPRCVEKVHGVDRSPRAERHHSGA